MPSQEAQKGAGTPLDILRGNSHAHQTNQSSQLAPDALASSIASSPDPAEALYDTCDAIQALGLGAPQALDLALQTYASMSTKLPDKVENSYGKGKDAAIGQLRWWLIETCNFFQGGSKPVDVGQELVRERELGPEQDQASLQFNNKEVNERLPNVLARIKSFREERNGHIIALAMLGRAHAKGIVKINRGEFVGDHIATLVDAALQVSRDSSPKWRKVDYIAECVLLRSCAKSLMDSMPKDQREARLKGWRDGFAQFLSKDLARSGDVPKNKNGDFEVAVHAAVCHLFNLQCDSPKLT